ncbi:MAG: nucleotidyltransferase domain-containing protein, partial [Bacteroidota bacterium]
MVTQQTAIRIVKDLAADIRASGFPLKKAILFGSYARSQQHTWSDIDLALVADEFSGVAPLDLEHFVYVLIGDKKYIDIEPHTFNTDDFEKGNPFVNEIKRTGIEIFSAEPAHL